jgi:uncharacterized phiE125 gp8 family phage protein
MKPDTIRVLQWPAVEPVSLVEVKHQLGMMPEEDHHDAFLLGKVAAARRYVERRLGQTLVATQYRATWRSAPAVLTIPNPPLLVSEAYPLTVTADGVAIASGDLEVDADAMPALVEIPSGSVGPIVATYWGGVAPGAGISPQIRAALLLYCEHLFKNRGVIAEDGAVELPQAFEALLASESHSGGY